jgi:hypothetical protein
MDRRPRVEALLGDEQVDEIWQLHSFDDSERAAVPPTSPRSKDAATFPRDDFAEPELTWASRTQSRRQSTRDERPHFKRLLSASKGRHYCSGDECRSISAFISAALLGLSVGRGTNVSGL